MSILEYVHGDRSDSIAEAGLRIELARLALGAGEGRRLELPLTAIELRHGHELLKAEVEGGAVRLDVSRPTSGWAFRLRYTALVSGRCVRCLEHAELRYAIESREMHQPVEEDEELSSPYVTTVDAALEIGRWARDALALDLPHQFVCRPDCAGLCQECGVSLNDVDPATHRHEAPRDPRFAVLDELLED